MRCIVNARGPRNKADSSKENLPRVERLLPILLGYAKVLGLFLVAVFFIASWTELRALLPRLSHFKALGVEFNVTELATDMRTQAQSVKAPSVTLEPADYNAVLARALKVQSVFQGATILMGGQRSSGQSALQAASAYIRRWR